MFGIGFPWNILIGLVMAGGVLFAGHQWIQHTWVDPAYADGAADQKKADQKIVNDKDTEVTVANKDRDQWKTIAAAREQEATGIAKLFDDFKLNHGKIEAEQARQEAATKAIATKQAQTAAAFAAENKRLREAAATRIERNDSDELKAVRGYLDDALGISVPSAVPAKH